jgi:hypothetical protein
MHVQSFCAAGVQYLTTSTPTVLLQATGFPGKMLPGQGSGLIGPVDNEECEILGDCDELAAEAMIR